MAIHTIQELPETTLWWEIEEKIRFVADVQQAMGSLDKGKALPVDQVKSMIQEWSSR